MDQSNTYEERKGRLETYFDRTAADKWTVLTTEEPVSGIRQTVRAGRVAMRATLLNWLPNDLTGRRILDAGCGTGALAVEAARRGADVVGVDVSSSLIDVAKARTPADLGSGSVLFVTGDMLSADFGQFDHIVAMDSLIHYRLADVLAAVEHMAPRVSRSILFTFAPRTPLLAAMHWSGKLFPRDDRSPAIEPHAPNKIEAGLSAALAGQFQTARNHRVSTAFYKSQALELVSIRDFSGARDPHCEVKAA
ncbi:MAG: magnesium protoporphyrin IX methyltransferase [Pseudomonadota bacterium]